MFALYGSFAEEIELAGIMQYLKGNNPIAELVVPLPRVSFGALDRRHASHDSELMKALIIKLLLAGAVLHCVTPVQSQPAFYFGQPTLGGGWGGGSDVQGWEFVARTSVSVVELGLYDGQPTGVFQQPHEVAIWDGNGDLITSASIPQHDLAPLLDNFRYVDIPSVRLSAGETYVIGAFMPAPATDYVDLTTGGGSFDPRIKYTAYRFGPAWSGISFPRSRLTGYVGAFGPNFIMAVPEPSSFTLMLAIAAATVLWVLQKRRMPPTALEPTAP